MKTKPILITLSLLTATSLLCGQEVYANELESKPVVHNNQSLENDDWFVEEDDIVDKPSVADDRPINKEVSDLFGDAPTLPSEEVPNTEKVVSSDQEDPEALEEETSTQDQASPIDDKSSKVGQEGLTEEIESVRGKKQPTLESSELEPQEETVSQKEPEKTPMINEEVKDTLTSQPISGLEKNFLEDRPQVEHNLASAVEPVEPIWKLSDFIIKNQQIIGFTKEGINKLRQTGHLVLPDKDEAGQPIVRVASFAFTPNKKTAIPDYTSRPGENGKVDNLDVDQQPIINEGEEFSSYALKSLTIPEGYLSIGSDAFTENKNLTSINLPQSLKSISDYAFAHNNLSQIILPSSLEKIGDNAFFDNRISKGLVLPESLKDLGERAFKSNRISKLVSKSPSLKVFKEAVFEDNSLSNIVIESPIEKIEENAFAANPGDAHYGNVVVINSSKAAKEIKVFDKHVYVNPGKDKETALPNLDMSKWLVADFTYDGTSVTGFSNNGLLKIRHNKHLEIPKLNAQGESVTAIAANAFRNVDFENKTLRKYDIEELILPSTIKTIGDFAFQSNNLTSFEASEELEVIGQGAFMNNQIDVLDLNDKLKTIGDAAFHINRIHAIVIPENVEKIGISAFRQNGAQHLLFLGNKLSDLGEMAFLSNALTDINLSGLDNLKLIPVQAFADNLLETVALPPHLESISAQAFRTNRLSDMVVPNSLQNIVFNAFDQNTGHPKYKKVLIETKDKLVSPLADGDFFVVNPDVLSRDMTPIADLLKLIKELDLDQLQETTKFYYLDLAKRAEELLNNKLSQGAQNQFVKEAKFFMSRIDLDKSLKEAILVHKSHPHYKDSSLLEGKIGEAKVAYTNSALSDQRINRLIKVLNFLSQLVKNDGKLGSPYMVEGVYHLESPLPIPDYFIALNLYFDKDGKIIFILDRSEQVGQNQFDDYGNPIMNIDEDNEGYHSLAIATLADYEGLSIQEILHKDLSQLPQIRLVEKAAYHREGIFLAIKDACQDALKVLADNATAESQKEQAPSEKIETSATQNQDSLANSFLHDTSTSPRGLANHNSQEKQASQEMSVDTKDSLPQTADQERNALMTFGLFFLSLVLLPLKRIKAGIFGIK
ncbi:leucine-rich repeat adhesin HupY/LrrG [Streptococcus hongkongensis]|nr:cell wall anchor protein [Streptococcus uberis]